MFAHVVRANRGSPGAIPGHVLVLQGLHTLRYHLMTYEQSVLDAADEFGYLSRVDAMRLLKDHGVTALDAYVSMDKPICDAQALLHFLGY